jgi:hypothetical protein
MNLVLLKNISLIGYAAPPFETLIGIELNVNVIVFTGSVAWTSDLFGAFY